MKTNTIQKINNLGKAGHVICKIARVVLSIGIIACLVGVIFMCFVPREAAKITLSSVNRATVEVDTEALPAWLVDLDTDDGTLEVNGIAFTVTDPMGAGEEGGVPEEHTYHISDIKWFLLAAALCCAAGYAAFYHGGKLCGYFQSCETPFSEIVAKELTWLAWSLIPVCVLSSLMSSFTDSLVTGQLDLVLGVDLTTVFMILCVFLLSWVFKYGIALQTESDETL